MTGKRLFLLVFLAVLVLVGLASYGSFPDMGRQLASFPLTHLAAALALASLNYLLRFFRWTYYLRVLHIRVPFGLSVLTFLSGLAMSVTPGKVGELLKSYLLRDRASIPVASSAPVVLMERLTDLVSVVLLGLTGMALLPLPVVLVLAAALFLSGGGMLVLASRLGDRLVRLPYLRRWDSAIQASREGLRALTRPQVVLVAVILGTLAWLSEGVALWVVVQGLDAEVSLSHALPIYAAATLVGAVSALPGGLVGTEGSMVVLLQQAGITRAAASAGTLLVRLVTLGFAVVIGLAALAWLHRRQRVVAASSPGGEADGSGFGSPSRGED